MLLQMARFHSFLWLSNIPLHTHTHTHTHTHAHKYMCHIFFIHSSVDGHLGCFHILAIVNNAAVKIGVHVSFRISVFVFFGGGYIPRSGIAGLYGGSVFSFLSKRHAVFQSGCTNLHSHSQRTGAFSLQPHQHLLFAIFLMIVILTGVR